jgi:NTP pyrophosphatase (non-canonical NTP hydrolase)
MLDFQKAAQRTMKRDWTDAAFQARLTHRAPLLNYALGVAGEAGELVDAVKKHVFHGHELNKSHLIKECGDVIWYATAIGLELGMSFEEILAMNVAKLMARYPEGFSEHASINREEKK